MDFSAATTVSDRDWRAWAGRNVAVRDGGITLAETTSIQQSALGSEAVDIAVGPGGVRYTLRPSGALYRYDPETDLKQRLLKRTAPSLSDPRAICAAADRVFVADAADGAVAVVSPRLQRAIGRLDTAATEPVEIGHAAGSVYVLDRDGQLVTVGRGETTGPTIDWWLQDPIDLVVDGGRVFVLDGGPDGPTIRAFWNDRDVAGAGFPIRTFEAGGSTFEPTALTATADTLLVAGTREDGSPGLFAWDPEAGTFRKRHALSARCHQLVGHSADSEGHPELYGLFGDERAAATVTEVTRYARHPERGRHVGTAVHRYDSGAVDTAWHRLVVETAAAAASTQLRVRYRASDDPDLLALDSLSDIDTGAAETLSAAGIDSGWAVLEHSVTDLEAAGLDASTARAVREAALARVTDHARERWTTVDSLSPEDVFLEAARGRYLFVSLELVGSPESAPTVESVRALCPRQSYLRYMPELYREDDRSAAFLERYLSVFETVFADIEADIEDVTRYVDPEGVPSESLSWLEGWLAVDTHPEWPEAARRELLARAPELYRKRGTKAGMRALVELYLRHATPEGETERAGAAGLVPDSEAGPAVALGSGDDEAAADTPSGHRLFFLEDSDLDRIDDSAAREAFASALPSAPSFALYCGPFDSDAEREAVTEIATSEKPAHVGASVVTLDDECTLDGSTFLGINSTLAPREFALGDAPLGGETVLQTRDSRR